MADDHVNLASLGKASYPALKTPQHWHEDHARAAAELVADGSIEWSGGHPDQAEAVAGLLPYGMPVFVPALPRDGMTTRLRLIACLREAGFEPVPHLAARRIPSAAALRDFLAEGVGAGGVRRVVVIGGDDQRPDGPYGDARALLESGLLGAAGIREVALAGYPEGHPSISPGELQAALLAKLAVLEQQGLGAQVVTQFSFTPSRIIEYCSVLARLAPGVPVFAGIAGPASLRQLVHYARYCGVAASLSAVRSVGLKIAQLLDHARADEQLGRLATYNAAHGASNLIGVHVYSFGGVPETAAWMRARLNPAA